MCVSVCWVLLCTHICVVATDNVVSSAKLCHDIDSFNDRCVQQASVLLKIMGIVGVTDVLQTEFVIEDDDSSVESTTDKDASVA